MPLELIALRANLTAEHADTQAGPGLAGGRRGPGWIKVGSN